MMTQSFHNCILEPIRGKWSQLPYVNIKKEDIFTVFESNNEPGLVLWPSVWQEKDGLLKMSFAEVLGDPYCWPPRYLFGPDSSKLKNQVIFRYICSKDKGRTWHDAGWTEEPDPLWDRNCDIHSVRHLVLPDGRLWRIRGRTNPKCKTTKRPRLFYAPYLESPGFHPFYEGGLESENDFYRKFFAVEVSKDGGRHFETICRKDGTSWWATGARILRDGCMAWMGFAELPLGLNDTERYVMVVSESGDGGCTWLEPIPLAVDRGIIDPLFITEEVDFVQLDDELFLVLARIDAKGQNLQLRVRRPKAGKWIVEDVSFSPLPHSGFPFLLQCQNGTILHQGLQSHYATADQGQNWSRHELMQCYYGQMLEIEAGRVFAVTQVDACDEPYPHKHDTFLRGCIFQHFQSNQWCQNDSNVELALSLDSHQSLADAHIKSEIKLDGCAGVVLRADLAGKSFYAFVLQLESNPSRFFSPASIPEQAFFVSICKIENGKLACFAKRAYPRRILPGSFLQVQFRCQTNNLMGAVRFENDPPLYVSCRDEQNSIQKGFVGVCSDMSAATFRNFMFSEKPGYVRLNW